MTVVPRFIAETFVEFVHLPLAHSALGDLFAERRENLVEGARPVEFLLQRLPRERAGILPDIRGALPEFLLQIRWKCDDQIHAEILRRLIDQNKSPWFLKRLVHVTANLPPSTVGRPRPAGFARAVAGEPGAMSIAPLRLSPLIPPPN